MDELIGNLLRAIDAIVDHNAPWTEKREAILEETKMDSNLEEFLTWFEPEDEE